MTQHLAEQPSAPETTLAAWADMDEDEPGELVDGHLVEEEDAGAPHDALAAWFVWILKTWLGPRGGFVLISDTRFGVAGLRAGVIAALETRGIPAPDDARARVASCEDPLILQGWLIRALTAGTATEALAE